MYILSILVLRWAWASAEAEDLLDGQSTRGIHACITFEYNDG